MNVGSREEMLAAHTALSAVVGVQDLEDPADSEHGFSGFSFRDPEGNVWDVAWKRGSDVSADGRLTWSVENSPSG